MVMSEFGNVKQRISLKDLKAIKKLLIVKLCDQLEEEIEEEQFDCDDSSDLWDTPAVDSKAVFKISSTMKNATGYDVEPEWVTPGGYDDVEQAVESLVEQLELQIKKSGSSK